MKSSELAPDALRKLTEMKKLLLSSESADDSFRKSVDFHIGMLAMSLYMNVTAYELPPEYTGISAKKFLKNPTKYLSTIFKDNPEMISESPAVPKAKGRKRSKSLPIL